MIGMRQLMLLSSPPIVNRYNRCKVVSSSSNSSSSSRRGAAAAAAAAELRSPDLVALEYADLKLEEMDALQVGHVRIRQHVNPLSSSFTVPVPIPDWKQVFKDSTLPLMVDIGSVAGFLFGFQKGPLNIKTIWGLKLGEHVAVQHC